MDNKEMTKKILAKRKEQLESRAKFNAKKKIKMPICEVCKKNISVGVYCVPSVPISCAYCQECLNMDAHPWWVLVSNTACCGGLHNTADWWKWMVTNTYNHLGKSLGEFLVDVEKDILKLQEYFETEKQINNTITKSLNNNNDGVVGAPWLVGPK